MAALGDQALPEQRARVRIDAMLGAAGWVVQDYKAVHLHAAEGVAVRELVTNAGPADYVLFVNRQAVGVIEAKKQGTTLAELGGMIHKDFIQHLKFARVWGAAVRDGQMVAQEYVLRDGDIVELRV